MIKSFRHKGLKKFFETGSTVGIQPAHKRRLARQLHQLNVASRPEDMNLPGWRLHTLQGNNPKKQDVEGHYSVTVNGNWRLTFRFENGDAELLDYQDYH